MAGSQAGGVFVKGEVELPVHVVFDGPVPAHEPGIDGRVGVGERTQVQTLGAGAA